MIPIRFVALCIVAALLWGCATIKVERPQDKEGSQGLKVFPPKPYILVARAGDGGKVISVAPLMLPDQTDPHFLRQTMGIGKANLTVTVENGIFKSFGADVDSKIPELLKEVGGLATGYGAVIKSIAEAGKLDEESNKLRREAADTTKLREASDRIANTVTYLDRMIKEAGNLHKDQQELLKGARNGGEDIRKALVDPNLDLNQGDLDEFAKRLNAIANELEKARGDFPEEFMTRFAIAAPVSSLRAAATAIVFKPPSAPVFELYEVLQTKDGTTLKRIFP